MARPGSRQARALMKRLGLSHEYLLGVRFAINVGIATTIVWMSPAGLATAILSGPSLRWSWRRTHNRMGPPDVQGPPRQRWSRLCDRARVPSRRRCTRVDASDCPGSDRPCVFIRHSHQDLWRQAPITAAIVIAAGVLSGSTAAGLGHGLHKVAEVLFGCLVGLVVSWIMSKVWLIQPPAGEN